jgi:Domain of unknown function (DUF4424)
MRLLAAPLAASTLFAASHAFADDSTAELATGGLVFTRTSDIEIRAEDLYISTQRIHMTYRLFNHSSHDVSTLVAFPMPDITVSGMDDNIAVPTNDPENILGFSTTINGAPVKATVEQKVFARGIDRTNLLRELGIPLEPYLEVTNQALDRLPHEKWNELINLGLAATDQYDIGKGMTTHLEARWTLKTTYYWRQMFPARRELILEHNYAPSVGASAGTSLGSAGEEKETWYQDYVSKYCIDQGVLWILERDKAAAKDSYAAPYSEQRISYILLTGANWAGPIEDFRLTVDKGSADVLVSFCGHGVKKISATQFQVKYINFTPKKDFDVLFLTKYKKD